jgi:hypothetical protein
MLAGVGSLNAQALTMQMSNGWVFSFSGNVNVFAQYQSQGSDGTAGRDDPSGSVLTGSGGKGFYLGTGLLPAFATFAATGKEGNTDLGVHFGLAPEVQCGSNGNGGIHDCFGAQLDVRQVFLTAGGTWGQILMGKELGLFNRGNILNDQTLFGVGGGGIQPGGTTLGRIGYGYIYPNFVGQITYSTVSGKPAQLSIGLFDPSGFGPYTQTQTPRIEAEFTWKGKSFNFFINGTVQNAKDVGTDQSKTATGVGGGAKWAGSSFNVSATGYYGKGIGTTLQFSQTGGGGNGVGTDGELRTSYGYVFQAGWNGAKTNIEASYGTSALDFDDAESAGAGSPRIENSLFVVGIYHQLTKSLKGVIEGNYMLSDIKGTDAGVLPADYKKNTAFTMAVGAMLFY